MSRAPTPPAGRRARRSIAASASATSPSFEGFGIPSARRIWCGSGRLTLHARFGYKHWPAMLIRRRRWLDRASGLRRRRPGGCDMGSLGPTHLISLLLAVAIIAATCGLIASAVTRRNKRRTRGFFLLGFFCGLMAGAILHGRRRGLNRMQSAPTQGLHRPVSPRFALSLALSVPGRVVLIQRSVPARLAPSVPAHWSARRV